ncbi:hypothetical protein BKA65DRAFT_506768 [Rhexocercosporidium sp. MPI-PUGE-AT-0058]|nr:hypothetical protein BKA65DRAFT_506768 [Rhexocercosporidium sp. MPI-PUGE-AT-0058]
MRLKMNALPFGATLRTASLVVFASTSGLTQDVNIEGTDHLIFVLEKRLCEHLWQNTSAMNGETNTQTMSSQSQPQATTSERATDRSNFVAGLPPEIWTLVGEEVRCSPRIISFQSLLPPRYLAIGLCLL